MKNIIVYLFSLLVMLPAYSGEIAYTHLLGKFDPKTDSLFVVVPESYSGKADTQYLRKEAMDAFIKMATAAKKDGITLKIVSATRTFYAQKAIWEAKWNRGADTHKKLHERARHILRYSSMPGTSRHHWGTDVDINSVESDYFASGKGKKEYEWLVTHAKTYGFFQPYTPKGLNRPEGYEEEEWHWSYAPLSDQFMREYASRIGYEDIDGFRGSEMAKPLKVITNYVLGIQK
ncbi:MAG: M15 family metallopeptidase [Chlamydiales bacterium]|nr:M15 family metallopeptidase [Chlamydiales bacterium]